MKTRVEKTNSKKLEKIILKVFQPICKQYPLLHTIAFDIEEDTINLEDVKINDLTREKINAIIAL